MVARGGYSSLLRIPCERVATGFSAPWHIPQECSRAKFEPQNARVNIGQSVARLRSYRAGVGELGVVFRSLPARTAC